MVLLKRAGEIAREAGSQLLRFNLPTGFDRLLDVLFELGDANWFYIRGNDLREVARQAWFMSARRGRTDMFESDIASCTVACR